MIKLSQSLYDAQISGNTEEAERIKAQIEEHFKNSQPKVKDNVVQFNTILNDDKSSAKSVFNFMTKELGGDWWEWEIETIYKVLWLKFSVALEDINRDKILAIRHLCNSDQPFWDWYEFNQMALSFSGSIADFEFFKKPSPGMVINAVKIMNYIRPDRQGQFNNEVVKYICISLKDDGIYVPPPSLYLLISDKFKDMVSDEIKKIWKNIYDVYQELVNNKTIEIKEETEYIQARRIFSAEAAAVSYGS